jgi:uncharacterized membrane protein YdbT with pleckstrin-like domain
MAKNDFSLLPGEKIEEKPNPHWWFFWQHIVAGIGVILLLALWISVGGESKVAKFTDTTLQWLFILALVVWIVALGLRLIEWRTTTFIVTDKRVAYQSGLIRRNGMSIQLNRINNVSYEQGLLERLLRNGTVTIESAAEQGTTVFRNIPNPNETRQLIYREIEADEQRDSNRDGQAVADAIKQSVGQQPVVAAAPTSPGATERLQELQKLYDEGLINDADFATKKAEILKDL